MIRYIYILVIALLLSVSAYAQRSWLGISPIVATSVQFDDSPLTTPKVGAMAGVGFTYQLQKRHFLMEVGVEGTYNLHRVALADSLLVFPMVDTKGTPFLYKGLLYDRQDLTHSMAIRVPLMFGAEFTYVYFLAGAKLHINFQGNNSARASLTTSGEYDIFYDDVVNMPSHGFEEAQPVKSYTDFVYNIDLRPSIELGAVLNYRPSSSKMYLGLFAEYGVLNTMPRQHDAELIIPDLSQYMQFELNHIYATPHASRLNNLSVGIRFTAFLQPQSNRQGNCHCIID
jgi:hypothetical protein